MTGAARRINNPRMTVDIPAFAKWLEDNLGLSPVKAAQYANSIGDTPEVDSEGLVVIRDLQGKIIDRVSIPLD